MPPHMGRSPGAAAPGFVGTQDLRTRQLFARGESALHLVHDTSLHESRRPLHSGASTCPALGKFHVGSGSGGSEPEVRRWVAHTSAGIGLERLGFGQSIGATSNI